MKDLCPLKTLRDRQRGNPSKRGTEIAVQNNPEMRDKEQPMRGAAK